MLHMGLLSTLGLLRQRTLQFFLANSSVNGVQSLELQKKQTTFEPMQLGTLQNILSFQ
jgi:hypothetical protein